MSNTTQNQGLEDNMKVLESAFTETLRRADQNEQALDQAQLEAQRLAEAARLEAQKKLEAEQRARELEESLSRTKSHLLEKTTRLDNISKDNEGLKAQMAQIEENSKILESRLQGLDRAMEAREREVEEYRLKEAQDKAREHGRKSRRTSTYSQTDHVTVSSGQGTLWDDDARDEAVQCELLMDGPPPVDPT